MRDLDTLAARELLDRGGQIIFRWHCCPVHQNRDDRHVAIEGGFDLDADEVTSVIEAAAIVLVFARKPVMPDEGNESVTSSDPLGQDFNEIATGRDAVDVNKYALAPEARDEAVVDASGKARRVFPSIANEDAA